MDIELYKPFKNNTKSVYKFFVYVKADNKRGYKKIGFGNKNYQDFTEHKDLERRRRYLKRAKGIKDKDGNLTYKNKNTKNYWSIKYLWDG